MISEFSQISCAIAEIQAHESDRDGDHQQAQEDGKKKTSWERHVGLDTLEKFAARYGENTPSLEKLASSCCLFWRLSLPVPLNLPFPPPSFLHAGLFRRLSARVSESKLRIELESSTSTHMYHKNSHKVP